MEGLVELEAYRKVRDFKNALESIEDLDEQRKAYEALQELFYRLNGGSISEEMRELVINNMVDGVI